MPAGLQPLRDDGVHAVRLQPACLVHCRRGRQNLAPVARTRASRPRDGRPKWKLTTAGANSSRTSAISALNGDQPGPPEWRWRRGRTP